MSQSKVGYFNNIEDETLENANFRKVIYTGMMQLVLMTLKPGEDIGEEIHEGHDQFFRIESGTAAITIGDEKFEASDDFAAIVPSGVKHNVTNTSATEVLRLYTIYAPAEHPVGTIHEVKPI